MYYPKEHARRNEEKMYSFYNFLGTTGHLALGIISYAYFKLLLGKKLANKLLLLFLCGTLAYSFIAAVHYLVFKEILFYIVVIPVVLIVGIKYKSRGVFKAIHPLLAALIILMLFYFFHVIFGGLGELVQ